MSELKNTNRKNTINSGKEQTSKAFGSSHSGSKLAGTRVGTLNDLRGGSTNGPSDRSQHGKRLRDGQ